MDLALLFFDYVDALLLQKNNNLIFEYEQTYSSLFSSEFLHDLRKAIFESARLNCLSELEAILIIKRKHPRFIEVDRYVKRDEHGLLCTLFEMKLDDGRYVSLYYYLDKPNDPFNGRIPSLIPCV